MKIAVDFDGTCVSHEYPLVGKDINAVPVLKRIIENGHKIILFTMRSGKELQDAIDWFEENEISLYGVNTDPDQKAWTNSPKAHANIYIDDAGLFMPLLYKPAYTKYPFVDWKKVEIQLENMGILLF